MLTPYFYNDEFDYYSDVDWDLDEYPSLEEELEEWLEDCARLGLDPFEEC